MSVLLKKKYSILLSALFFSACLNGEHHHHVSGENKILNIGHAGSGFNYLLRPFNPYPTNSLMSLKKAIENGADGVEVDLQLTSDHELVLFHDNTLDSHTALQGFIIEKESSELEASEYECGFPYDLFHDENIITLNRWLDYVKQLPFFPYLQIDLKTANSKADFLSGTMLKKLFEELNAVNYPLEKVILISGDRNFIVRIQNMYPEFNCAFQPSEFYEGMNWALNNNCKILIMDQKLLTAGEVSDAHKKGIKVIAMGGRSAGTLIRLIDMKPDFIQANNVKALYELLH